MPELAGRVVVVTGGETGIGRAAAEAAAAEGALIVVAGILAEEGEKTMLALREAGVTHLLGIYFAANSVPDLIDQMQLFAEEVMPHLR